MMPVPLDRGGHAFTGKLVTDHQSGAAIRPILNPSRQFGVGDVHCQRTGMGKSLGAAAQRYEVPAPCFCRCLGLLELTGYDQTLSHARIGRERKVVVVRSSYAQHGEVGIVLGQRLPEPLPG